MPLTPTPSRGGIMGGAVDGAARVAARFPEVEARPGLRLLHKATGFLGALALHADGVVELVGATGLRKRFKDSPGSFFHDGAAVRLVTPRAGAPDVRVSDTVRTASGSRAVIGAQARVAQASRIWVEGLHDAELVERVWGDDLRLEGIVVEPLDGIDHLAEAVRDFAPGPGRRLGVLVDHLVPNSKEARLAAAVRHEHVLVAGTPYVDVWQAVRPAALGISAWPVIPRGVPWKEGVCAALRVGEPRDMWRRILGSVEGWRDLEPDLVGAVEGLVDFVTA